MDDWYWIIGAALAMAGAGALWMYFDNRRIAANMQRDVDRFNRGDNPWETPEEKAARSEPPKPTTEQKIAELLEKNKR